MSLKQIMGALKGSSKAFALVWVRTKTGGRFAIVATAVVAAGLATYFIFKSDAKPSVVVNNNWNVPEKSPAERLREAHLAASPLNHCWHLDPSEHLSCARVVIEVHDRMEKERAAPKVVVPSPAYTEPKQKVVEPKVKSVPAPKSVQKPEPPCFGAGSIANPCYQPGSPSGFGSGSGGAGIGFR